MRKITIYRFGGADNKIYITLERVFSNWKAERVHRITRCPSFRIFYLSRHSWRWKGSFSAISFRYKLPCCVYQQNVISYGTSSCVIASYVTSSCVIVSWLIASWLIASCVLLLAILSDG